MNEYKTNSVIVKGSYQMQMDKKQVLFDAARRLFLEQGF
ncbi:hypothetical protein TMU3MR103_2042 [Tetragenococcus muriaticus 3MR10-3]|uniref:Uncharacterized protein n=1 Tax=Tetragenococcus muriaticus 3MR10-3 TaxID=1302648 RepID=A0A091CBW9_9ENTE|nr:hypothetical protein TMU3MR103_2042 [Tetragenococcus muriaticus 3MR10-3]